MEDLNGKLILEVVAGSRAYGLDTSESDTDMKGIYVAKTRDLLSLPMVGNVRDVVDGFDPDYSYYEVGKYVNLALKCNPTVLELLYIDDPLVETPEGALLKSIRGSFLSRQVYNSYGKYAMSQAYKMQKHPDAKRYEKNLRHTVRLLLQGSELLKTGSLTVKVKNRDELFELGKMAIDDAVKYFESEYNLFMSLETDLPDAPDYKAINEVLLKIREMNS